MFAQAGGRTANPWTISVSIAIQSMLIATAILFPLLRIEALPPVKLVAMSKAPRHVDLVVVPEFVEKFVLKPTSLLTLPSKPRVFAEPTPKPRALDPSIDTDTLFDAAPNLTPTADTYRPIPFVGGQPVAPSPPPQSPKERTTQPSVTTEKPYRVGGDVTAPVLRSAKKPAYPDLARRTRTQGTVRLNGIISRDGTVRSLEVISGHPLLIQAAIEAVRAWLYDPARLNGQPVDVILVIDVNFTLAQ